MAAGFADALRRHSLQVAKLEGAQADEFLRLLRDLQDTLRGRYAAMGGLDKSLDAYRLMQVISETEAGIKVLEQKAGRVFRAGQDDAADLSIDHIIEEIARLSSTFDGERSVISVDAAAVLADPVQGLLANHFDTSVRRYGLDMLNDVRRRLFVGMRAGDTLGSVVSSVSGKQGTFGTSGRSNAERIVRTEVSQAYGAAHHSSMKQAAKEVPGLKKVWLHVGSYLCKFCGPLHGTERPMDGTWTIKIGRKTREVAHAPAHPNCACRVTAMKASWRDKMKAAGYLKDQPETNEAGSAHL